MSSETPGARRNFRKKFESGIISVTNFIFFKRRIGVDLWSNCLKTSDLPIRTIRTEFSGEQGVERERGEHKEKTGFEKRGCGEGRGGWGDTEDEEETHDGEEISSVSSFSPLLSLSSLTLLPVSGEGEGEIHDGRFSFKDVAPTPLLSPPPPTTPTEKEEEE